MINSITAFNNALKKANEWLTELKEIGNFNNEEQAYSALRSVLHALRNRLITDEAVHLGSELPMIIRGVYFEGFDLKNPSRKDDIEEFINTISTEMRKAALTISPEKAAQAVFALLESKISAGEINDVRNMLPKNIRKLLTSHVS